MKKMMSIAIVTLMMAGAAAYACDSCGCSAKKVEKKPACSTCEKAKTCTVEKKTDASCAAAKKCDACTAEKKCEACTKKCSAKKAAAATE